MTEAALFSAPADNEGATVGRSDEIRAKLLKLCQRDYKSTAELAAALGLSINTVRAYYVYPMVREGALKPLRDGRSSKQAYRKA